ncbi:MAG: aconitase X [Actinomycetota bacterium]
MKLSPADRTMLEGERGPGVALAMRVVSEMAAVMGADGLLDITRAHVDSCLYHGQVGLDFIERLADGGAAVTVPTTLNVGSLDLLHPDLYRGDREAAEAAHRLMDAYVAIGCSPTWTCAPYQLPGRPELGEQIAWAESNAIIFANSVLGARTNRYGDFLDISCAVTGRAPAAGLHLDEGRRATHVFWLDGLDEWLDEDWIYPLLGYLVGRVDPAGIPVIVGLGEEATEDRLKAFGAGAASTGAVAMFHAVGVTPEAPTLAAVVGSRALPESRIGRGELEAARRRITTALTEDVGAVSLGAPHYSATQLERLAVAVDGKRASIPAYVNTSRAAAAEAAPAVHVLEGAGFTIVTDTCTYITPIIDPTVRVVMTDSAKWAYYAPGNLGVGVVYASTSDCVARAVEGWR